MLAGEGEFVFSCLALFGICCAQRFDSFQDPIWGEFGLVDTASGAAQPHSACLTLKFHARLYNFNLLGTPIEASELANFTSQQVRLTGYCALPNEQRKSAQLQASWKSAGGRRRVLKFQFREGQLLGGRRHEREETRWIMEEVSYAEQYKGQSVSFSSLHAPAGANGTKSAELLSPAISAPFNQRFVCKDRLNVSLHNAKYRRVVLELLPEIDVQPMERTASGFGSNTYLCERTRRRTLAQSFQSRMTVFSGVVLGLSSVSLLAGYSLRRALHKQPSLGLAGDAASARQPQQQFYSSF